MKVQVSVRVTDRDVTFVLAEKSVMYNAEAFRDVDMGAVLNTLVNSQLGVALEMAPHQVDLFDAE